MHSTVGEPLRPINYGVRAKLGMLLPSGNHVAEPQINAMLPPGVSLHTTRLELKGGGEQLKMLERVEEAASLLVDAGVDRIVFHCTAVSMWSPAVARNIEERIGAVTPIPLVITSEAVVAALGLLQAQRIVLVTPYSQATNDREIAFLKHHGIEVLHDRALAVETAPGGMGGVTPEAWFRNVVEMRRPDAEAYFISCTAVRSAEVIEGLERELGRPVITSNQAMLWRALRSAGVDDAIAGYGRLLRDF
jgi:maleate isomerase